MKTLDEVIDLMEGADFIDWGADALHYLKELKEARNIIATAREEAKKQIEDFKADVEYRMAYNPALTWDELKQMEGKPVWVEVDGNWYGKFWAFIEVGNDAYMNFYQKGQEYPEDLWKRDIGITWQAYRKERE